jgi:hypothetical protein
LRARRGHFFINRLMLVLGHSIAVEKRNARCNTQAPVYISFPSGSCSANLATKFLRYAKFWRHSLSRSEIPSSYVCASNLPTVDDLLQQTISVSDTLKAELLESAA